VSTTVAFPKRIAPAAAQLPGHPVSPAARLAVAASAVMVVLARLPFLDRVAGPDEAGFLLVGGQWHPGGTSLYGDYWVDRPPLLVTIFRVAAELGGAVPLRLIGCLAAVVVVLGCAHVARQISGPRAAGWSAAIAAALCVSPLLGGLEVNGELLAAPFVVVGVAAVLRAVREETARRAAPAAAVAGAATVAALLVKQNMADVAVFAAVVVLVAWRRGDLSARRLRQATGWYAVGAVVTTGAAACWTLLHGTSLIGVFDATYPFRIEAGRVLASSSHQHATARLWLLLASWVMSGGAVIMVVVAWALVSRRLRGAGVWALIATMLFDLVSIGLGGSYWHHYLVQLVVPVAVAAGVLVAGRQPGIRPVLLSALLVAAVAWGGAVPGPGRTSASSVGAAVGGAAEPGDTIVTALGHADVTEASGLSSPYPYLWSLPARTLDPGLTRLDSLLAGPRAPTWFVHWSRLSSVGPASRRTERVLRTRYHRVAVLHGRAVYLLDGVARPTPRLPEPGTRSAAADPAARVPGTGLHAHGRTAEESP
jgi:hypothetical protein